MAIVDLKARQDHLLEAAIHWATTNKDYMDMRDRYIEFIQLLSNYKAYSEDDVIGRYFRAIMPEKLVELAAPSLSLAQQRKLYAVLSKISILLPQLNSKKQPTPKADAQTAQQNTDNPNK